jgi:hypothetical protein
MKTQSRTPQSFRIGDTVYFGDGQFKRWDAYQEQTHTDCRLHAGHVSSAALSLQSAPKSSSNAGSTTT